MHLRPETLTRTQTELAVAVVIVHYRTPHLVAQAVSALRHDIAQSPVAHGLECVIVDNGNDAAGMSILRDLGVTVLTADRNLGYAGGVNLGVARTQAPFVIVMNADVLVRPGCIASLIAELRRGDGAVAGPRFFWDRQGRLLLPPTERRDLTSDALAHLSTRGGAWPHAARRRWRRHARRHWDAGESIDSYALSGALLACRRDVWDAVGPFDEGFRLYFEETDWLARVAARGWRGRYVPAAQAVHLYNRSAADEPEARAWFAASARRFEEKHVGRLRARMLRWLDAAEATQPAPIGAQLRAYADAQGVTVTLPQDAEAARSRSQTQTQTQTQTRAPSRMQTRVQWIELSSQPAGYPAAAERLDAAAREWRLPEEVWRDLAPGRYTLRQIDDEGRERGETTFVR